MKLPSFTKWQEAETHIFTKMLNKINMEFKTIIKLLDHTMDIIEIKMFLVVCYQLKALVTKK